MATISPSAEETTAFSSCVIFRLVGTRKNDTDQTTTITPMIISPAKMVQCVFSRKALSSIIVTMTIKAITVNTVAITPYPFLCIYIILLDKPQILNNHNVTKNIRYRQKRGVEPV